MGGEIFFSSSAVCAKLAQGIDYNIRKKRAFSASNNCDMSDFSFQPCFRVINHIVFSVFFWVYCNCIFCYFCDLQLGAWAGGELGYSTASNCTCFHRLGSFDWVKSNLKCRKAAVFFPFAGLDSKCSGCSPTRCRNRCQSSSDFAPFFFTSVLQAL